MINNNNSQLFLHLQDNEWPLEYIDHDRQTARAIVFDDDGYFYFVGIDRDDDFGNCAYIETAGGGVEPGDLSDGFRILDDHDHRGLEISAGGGIGAGFQNGCQLFFFYLLRQKGPAASSFFQGVDYFVHMHSPFRR